MVKLVDTLDSKSSEATRIGSSPIAGIPRCSNAALGVFFYAQALTAFLKFCEEKRVQESLYVPIFFL